MGRRPVLEVAEGVRRKRGSPRFEQSAILSPVHWAIKFVKTISEWVAIPEGDRALMIAASIVSDAMETIATYPEDVDTYYAPMSTDDDLSKFISGMG